MEDEGFINGLLGGAGNLARGVGSGLSGLLGGGQTGGPSSSDPYSQMSPEEQRRMSYSALGQLGAILLAAGQRQTPAQRGQILAQLGGIGPGMEQQITRSAQLRGQQADAAQRRELFPLQRQQLMGQQADAAQRRELFPLQRQQLEGTVAQKQAEMQELEIIRERQRSDPEGLAASLGGVSADYVRSAGAADLREIGRKVQAARAMSGGNVGRPLTPEEYAQFKIPPNSPAVMTPAGPKILGAPGTTVNVGGETSPDGALRKQLSEDEGKRLSKVLGAGDVAGGTLQDFQVIDEVLKLAPQGPLTGRLVAMFPGASSAAAVLESFVKRIAPTLRAEGSGSTSDIEYAGMLAALPSLINKPEANAAIAETMKQKAQIMVDRAVLVRSYQNQTITADEMRKQMSALNSRSILSPKMRQLFEGMGATNVPVSGGQISTDPDGSITWTPGGTR